MIKEVEMENIKEIAVKLLNDVGRRTAEMDIQIDFTDAVAEKIADAGFDEIYGARPLRRAIQSQVEDFLADAILGGELKDKEKIIVTYRDKVVIE